MARKKTPPGHSNHERWLISYADFITLLFALFVVMFASSQTDRGKARQISESVRRALEENQFASALNGILGGTADRKGPGNAMRKGPGGARKASPAADKERMQGPLTELRPSLEALTRELKEEIAGGQMKLELQKRGLVVSLQQAAFFPSGEERIDPSKFAAIGKVAESIQKLPNPVRLEGHTDPMPIHNARYRGNWDLSAARSIAMLELLSGRFGVPRQRLAIAGYADTAPVAANDTELGRARNRRVDIVILSEQGVKSEPPRAVPYNGGKSTP
ncbi:MAG: OmpA family protein [Acidobacteria bacterium]|nr:OmpA family protein [Acidobacteriota bacterium]